MNISIIGGIPEPIGGVTQHVWRLSHLLKGHNVTVHDLNSTETKYPLNKARLKIVCGSGPIKAVRLLRDLHTAQPDIIHFHASLPNKLPILVWLIRTLLPRTRTVLTLHHGDLNKHFSCLSIFAQWRIKMCLRSISSILCLSEEQYLFYSSAVLNSRCNVIRSSSYLPVPRDIQNKQNPELIKPVDRWVNKSLPLLLISGQTSRLYQFDWAIRAVDQLHNHHKSNLIICTYGPIIDQAYIDELKSMENIRPYVKMLHNTPFLDFLTLQKKTDIFLRPTTTDSCGIAVWDAAHFGSTLIASDVCRRPAGTLLHAPNDYDSFIKHLENALTSMPDRSCTSADFEELLPPSICSAYGLNK